MKIITILLTLLSLNSAFAYEAKTILLTANQKSTLEQMVAQSTGQRYLIQQVNVRCLPYHNSNYAILSSLCVTKAYRELVEIKNVIFLIEGSELELLTVKEGQKLSFP